MGKTKVLAAVLALAALAAIFFIPRYIEYRRIEKERAEGISELRDGIDRLLSIPEDELEFAIVYRRTGGAPVALASEWAMRNIFSLRELAPRAATEDEAHYANLLRSSFGEIATECSETYTPGGGVPVTIRFYRRD